MTEPTRDALHAETRKVTRYWIGKPAHNRNTPETFWAKVDRKGPDECWPWLGCDRRGYGQIRWQGKMSCASRIAWTLTAQITPPKHLMVCHTCHNPPCCNPAHLYLGTNQQNQIDSVVAGRHSETRRVSCRHGHPLDGKKKNGRGVMVRFCTTCQRTRPNKARAAATREGTDG